MGNVFLLINVVWIKTSMTMQNIERIEVALGNFGDWFRFSGTTWIISTDLNEQVLYGAIKTILSNDDLFIVTRFDPDTFAGWGPADVEDWVNSRKLKLIPPPA